jgi:hypothetical protein
MKDFWNERYAADRYAYGTAPNAYFKHCLDTISKPGRLLLPAEGEGRNAVYAAQQGWDLVCFDISEEGRKKALRLAQEKEVQIDYRLGSLETIRAEERFDAVALIYTHFPAPMRKDLHLKLSSLIKEGGYLILEGFAKGNLAYHDEYPQIGGPKTEDMLFDLKELKTEFQGFIFSEAIELEVQLNEGDFHQGRGLVIRLYGTRTS